MYTRSIRHNAATLTAAVIATAGLFTACTENKFSPVPAANPWADDYSEFTPMDSMLHWGTYNVHDPAVRRVGDKYYAFSTDAIYFNHRPDTTAEAKPLPIEPGFIQMRRSSDLVNWEFIGWALNRIPEEAVEWVRTNAGGHGADNVWAPYMTVAPDGTYRLYFCVSAFGRNTSYIGMATADSPEGPWQHRGCVVKTDTSSAMNAIDPSVIFDKSGRCWMHYGSYFGGLYCVELDPATGMTLTPGDQGHLTARRANYRKDNLEAPEIIYNPELDKYFLFGSYDPLMTTYNVRVGRSDKAEGPFTDFFGKEMADTTDNYPILTAPYRFNGHPGWVGTAHCGVFTDGKGNYFMAHQGRYGADSGMMDFHIRQLFFTADGWPVVSPERYAATPARKFSAADLAGEWEVIRVTEPRAERKLEAGQILWGEGDLLNGEWNDATAMTLTAETAKNGFDPEKQLLNLTLDSGETIENLIIFAGHDWERETDTVLLTGLDADGRSVWGKRVK